MEYVYEGGLVTIKTSNPNSDDLEYYEFEVFKNKIYLETLKDRCRTEEILKNRLDKIFSRACGMMLTKEMYDKTFLKTFSPKMDALTYASVEVLNIMKGKMILRIVPYALNDTWNYSIVYNDPKDCEYYKKKGKYKQGVFDFDTEIECQLFAIQSFLRKTDNRMFYIEEAHTLNISEVDEHIEPLREQVAELKDWGLMSREVLAECFDFVLEHPNDKADAVIKDIREYVTKCNFKDKSSEWRFGPVEESWWYKVDIDRKPEIEDEKLDYYKDLYKNLNKLDNDTQDLESWAYDIYEAYTEYGTEEHLEKFKKLKAYKHLDYLYNN